MIHIQYLNNCVKDAEKHKEQDSEGIAIFLPDKEYKLLNSVLPNYEDKSLNLDEKTIELLKDIHYYILDLELRADKI